MTALTVEKTGTITLENGSTAVTGTGTLFSIRKVTGGILIVGGLSAVIASVESDTEMTLEEGWYGADVEDTSYIIQRSTSEAARMPFVHDEVSKVGRLLVNQVFFDPHAAGVLDGDLETTLAPYDDEPALFRFGLLPEFGTTGPGAVYMKLSGTSGHWSGGVSIMAGPQGFGFTGGYYNAGTGVVTFTSDDGLGFVTDDLRGADGAPGSSDVVGTSATSLAIGTGSKVFTDVETDRGWGIGARLRASSDADPANWMEGTVHTYSGTSLTLDVTHTNGSGSHNDWTINIAGEPSAGAVDSVNGQTGTVVIPLREALTANRTYYVGFDMGSVSISIATPAVVTKAAHGLVAGSRVSFSIKPNRKAAIISEASPAVITMANSFVAGQPVKFSSTGLLPDGLVKGTTYYVIATGLSGTEFQVSATPGGAAVDTTAKTVTISNASPGVVTDTAHGLVAGQQVKFATDGALPTGLTAGTVYYIKTVTGADTYTLASQPGGTAINTSSAGSGTHTRVQNGTHYCSETGVLPTGITEGQDYYVIASGLTTDEFQFSATSGGAAVDTSGATSGTISARTGSDTNDGLTNSAGGAFLTVAKAVATALAIDMAGKTTTVQVADGRYLAGISVTTPFVGGPVIFQGNPTYPENCHLKSGFGLYAIEAAKYSASGFALDTTSVGVYVRTQANISISNMAFLGGPTSAIAVDRSAIVVINSNIRIAGGYTVFVSSNDFGLIATYGVTFTLLDLPNFTVRFANTGLFGDIYYVVPTFVGAATGTRYYVAAGGGLTVGGGGEYHFPGTGAGTVVSGGVYA